VTEKTQGERRGKEQDRESNAKNWEKENKTPVMEKRKEVV